MAYGGVQVTSSARPHNRYWNSCLSSRLQFFFFAEAQGSAVLSPSKAHSLEPGLRKTLGEFGRAGGQVDTGSHRVRSRFSFQEFETIVSPLMYMEGHIAETYHGWFEPLSKSHGSSITPTFSPATSYYPWPDDGAWQYRRRSHSRAQQ